MVMVVMVVMVVGGGVGDDHEGRLMQAGKAERNELALMEARARSEVDFLIPRALQHE
jgi:hypothetical protein